MTTKPKIWNFSSICRTCMGTKCLSPIFDSKASVNYYSSAISMISGVNINKEDGLPQNICKFCIIFINSSIKFRKQSQSVEAMLLEAKQLIGLQEDKPDIKTNNNAAGDLSDDETLINYVKRDKKCKSHKKLSLKYETIKGIRNLNKKHTIKTETEIGNTVAKHKNGLINKITTEIDVKIEITDSLENIRSDKEYKQISIENCGQKDIISIKKKELDHETVDQSCYMKTKHNTTSHNHKDIETCHNDIETCQIDIETCHNDIETCDNATETSHNATVTRHNATETCDNATETSHSATETNHSVTKTSHNDTETFDNATETNHRATKTSHNDTETFKNDTGYDHNDAIPNSTNNYNNGVKTTNDKNTRTKNIIEKHKNMKNNRVSCKICYKDLSFRSLDVHMSKCHPDLDDRKTKCTLCGCYVTKNRMKRHLAVHGERFVCVYCLKEQTNVNELKVHAESCVQRIMKRSDNHSAKELKECDICHKIMQKGSLRLHKRLKHAGLGPVCEHCGKRLSNKFRLSEHLRARHGYEKHKCTLCDFQTAFRVHLENHLRRHSGERPFVCECCGAKFHALNQLGQHRHTHRDTRHFKCDSCPSSFKTRVNLSVHKNTAHSTAPARCAVCARHFRCTHYLLKHMRNVHRVTGPVALDAAASCGDP